MAKSRMSIEFFICCLLATTSILTLADQCDEKIFVLITKKTVRLVDFDSSVNSAPAIIYQTKDNTTIEDGLFHQRKNTIILLLNQSNESYSLMTLNAADDIYENWIVKSNKLIYSSLIHLTLGQRYIYLLNQQTMLLQIFNLPLTSTVFRQNSLSNLPRNSRLVKYLIDERFQYLWILFEQNFYQLYVCQLQSSSCQLYMNLFHLNPPIQFRIHWNTQQFYLYSRNYLILFQYNSNQTDYSIHYSNSTRQQFLAICERKNLLEYLSISRNQVCYHHCRDTDTTIDRIHTIERLSSPSNILHCSKQRRTSRIVLIILILIDLAVVFAALCWLTVKYISRSSMKKPISNGTIWISEGELITHF